MDDLHEFPMVSRVSAGPVPDPESAAWVAALTADGAARRAGLDRLHALLLRVCRHEVRRRAATGAASGVTGPELDDLAHQAADDATVAILAKLASFRGESRFTTWTYRFAVLEVSSKLGRHYWRGNPTVSLEVEDWDRLPARFGVDPARLAEGRELVGAVRAAITQTLSDRQRRLFIAVVVNGVPLDAVVAEWDTSRGAVYKAIFDARRKIRAFLVANGYLNDAVDPADADTTGATADSLHGAGDIEATRTAMDEVRRS